METVIEKFVLCMVQLYWEDVSIFCTSEGGFNMNELIAFVFALALALTLVSCNKEKSNKKKRLNRGVL